MNPFTSTVDFCSSLEEREMYETMADLFSIFLATESLEKSYIRDATPSDEY
jgi:VPS28-like protein